MTVADCCRRIASLAILLLLAACTPATPPAYTFTASDITGAGFGRNFRLADGNGATRSLSDFRGKVVLIFFGFTQCPDVCPTELARLADLRRRLGADADKVQVLFVTLDPERDTAQLVRDYVRAFDASFIGLRGEPETTAATAKEFKIFYQKVPGSASDRYTLNHSTSIYAFDPAGRLRLLLQGTMTPEQMIGDVRALIAGR